MSRRGSVVLDLDGVVYLGSTPIRGAAETISNLMRDGWQILFATNNSTKSSESIMDVLQSRIGLTVDPATIITSGMAAADYLVRGGVATAVVVGSPELSATVDGAGIELVDHASAEAVVVGLDRSLTYQTISDAADRIRDGAAFIATNTDATFPTPGGLVPGAGTVVAAIATASGVSPVVCGKPHEPMIRLVNRIVERDDVWMVGDRPETDIAFAKAAGWRSVLALTGVTSRSQDVPRTLTPDHVIGSVAELEGVLAEAVRSVPNEG